MLRHQLRQDLILGLDLPFQILDALLLGLLLGAGLILKGSGSVLEELLLPPVEGCWLEAQLFAELGDRLLVQQMPPQDGDLFVGGVVLPCLYSIVISTTSNSGLFIEGPTGCDSWRERHGMTACAFHLSFLLKLGFFTTWKPLTSPPVTDLLLL